MYEVMVTEEIDIIHKIFGEFQQYGILHEHHLSISVSVSLPDPQTGIFIPMRTLIDLIRSEIQQFDSNQLNNMPAFQNTRFLIEDLARVMYDCVEERIKTYELSVIKVEITDALGKVKIIYHK